MSDEPQIEKHRLEQILDIKAEVEAHTIDCFQALTEAEDFLVTPYLNTFETEQRAEQRARIQEILKDRSIFEAQAMYFRYTPLTFIAKETGIGVRTLNRFILAPGGWKEQREKVHTEIVEAVKKTALAQLTQGAELCLSTVIHGLQGFQQRLSEEKRAPNLSETELCTRIFKNLHKAKITEELTDPNKSKAPLSPREIVEAFSNDPYLMKSIRAANESKKELQIEEETLEPTKDGDTGSLAYPQR